jgi:hypothetical protein
VLSGVTAACQSEQSRLNDSVNHLASARATVQLAAGQWLDGRTSTTYTSIALETAYRLTETERQALAEDPAMAARPKAARVIADAQQQAFATAQLRQSVNAGDRRSVAASLAALQNARREP